MNQLTTDFTEYTECALNKKSVLIRVIRGE